MNLLCVIGLHSRVRDQTKPTERLIFSQIDEYRCRRCDGRWRRWVGSLSAEGSVVNWERIE